MDRMMMAGAHASGENSPALSDSSRIASFTEGSAFNCTARNLSDMKMYDHFHLDRNRFAIEIRRFIFPRADRL
jgi:hypothetical protein